MLFLFSLIIVLGFSVLTAALLRVSTRPVYLVAVYLIAYANNCLVGLILNSFRILNLSWAWLTLEIVFLAGIFYLWIRSARPALFGPFSIRVSPAFSARIRQGAKTYPDLFIFGIGVCLYFLLAIALNLVVPPNNNDSMSTHLSRVIYWLFNGSFFPWATPRIMQLFYPVNAQLQLFWTILFWGSDLWAGFIQYSAGLACLVSVFGIARVLGANPAQSSFAALVCGSYPVLQLHLTTPQNDLVTAGLFLCLVFLLLSGLQSKNRSEIALSGLAFGLLMGTKQTAFFLLPGLGVLLVLVWLFFHPRPTRQLGLLAASAIIFTLIFGIYMNVSNLLHFGHPFGPPEEVSRSTGSMSPSELLTNLGINSTRLLYQMLDPSGIPDPLWGYSIKLKALVFKPIFDLLHIPIEGSTAVFKEHVFNLRYRPLLQEDSAWYGPLWLLLFLPVLVYQLIGGVKNKHPYRMGFPLIFITFLMADAAFRPGWDPFQARYFLPAIAVGTTLVGFAFQPTRWSRVLRWTVTILAWSVMLSVAFLNTAKPISGDRNIWTMDRIAKLTLQGHFMLDVTRMVEREVPSDAVLGMLAFGPSWEYPLFGERFTRQIIPVHPIENLYDLQWIQEKKIQYVLIQASSGDLPSIPRYLAPISGYYEWVIYQVRP